MEKKLTVIPPSQTNGNAKSASSSQCRVAAYCRVSTEQEEQLGSFANQIAYYTDYINEKEEYQLAGIFSDEGISGTGTRKRAGFRSMIAACEAGKVDLVITKSISRFARNTRDCLHYARYLKSLGIPVIFEKEGINTMESSGELLFTILSSLAQEDHEIFPKTPGGESVPGSSRESLTLMPLVFWDTIRMRRGIW